MENNTKIITGWTATPNYWRDQSLGKSFITIDKA